MHTITLHDENKYFHRPETITSLSNESDQLLTITNHSTMEQFYEYSHLPQFDNTQPFNIDGEYQYSESYPTTDNNLQTITENYNEDYNYYHTSADDSIQSWEQLLGEASHSNYAHQDVSQSNFIANQMADVELQQQFNNTFQYNQDSSSEEIDPNEDYETIIRSRHLYYDPEPKIIRKPTAMTNPVVYKQNVTVRYLQPPPVLQGPLIIREVRPPQPPPLPPLIIRQRPVPPRSQSPIILREKPPRMPDPVTEQVVTRTLPPLPPPLRSVIIEKLPPLPPKPRDIIIERWLPYESTQKRKIIVQRAEETKPQPPPKNIIITYELVQPKIIRRYEQLGVQAEDPNRYSALYGDSLIDREQLLIRTKELGVTEDLSPPHLYNKQQQQASFNIDEQNNDYNMLLQQQNYNGINNNYYAPTNRNLTNGSSSTLNYVESNDPYIGHDNQFYSINGDDLSAQLTRLGIMTEFIPHQNNLI